MHLDMTSLLTTLRVFWSAYPWLSQVLVALGSALFLTYVCYFFFRKIPTFFTGGRYRLTYAFLEALYWPALVVIWAATFIVTFQPWIVSLDHILKLPLSKLLAVGCVLLIVGVLVRFIRILEAQYLLTKRVKRFLDDTTIRTVSKCMQVSVQVIALLVVLPFLGVNVAGLWALGGGSAIVVGIGTREMLANYFGGLVIYTEGSFRIGDWIHVPKQDIEGAVESIGWRATRLRTADQKACYIPNATLSSSIVINASRMGNYYIQKVITIRSVDVALLNNIIQEARTMLQAHPDIDQHKPVLVHCIEFGSEGSKLAIAIFTKTTDRKLYRDIQQDVSLKLLQLIARNGLAPI